MTWTQDDRDRLARMAADAHRGYGDGRRDLCLRTQYETTEWRALSKEFDAARNRLNGLLPPSELRRRRAEGVTFLADRWRFDSGSVQAALGDYRLACAQALITANPKPRRILTMIRLAAEIAGAPDPVFSAADWGGGLSAADIAFNKLFRQTERALRAGGVV